jgi:hypothetical protein
VPRSAAETDAWIASHEREHDSLEARMRTIVRDESKDALEGMKKHVAGLEGDIANVDGKVAAVALETRGQTATIDAIKTNSDTLVRQSLDSAEERGRRKTIDEQRTRTLRWFRFVIVPIAIAIGGWIVHLWEHAK